VHKLVQIKLGNFIFFILKNRKIHRHRPRNMAIFRPLAIAQHLEWRAY